jgi:UDP-glucose 4-epimerase
MKALVTGGAGFIGSQVADALIEKGISVEIIDNLSTGRKENLPAKAVFHYLDICSKDIHELFAKAKYDVVFHLAAQMDIGKSAADPAFDAQSNIIGGINLLQASKENRVGKFVFSSSCAIYGEQIEFPATERHPQNPVSPYGISKLAFEKYLDVYHKEYGFNYVALRYANVCGPRQRGDGEGGVVAIFFNRLLAGQKAVIYSDGLQTRDFIYVGDVVRANLAAMDYQGVGIFNVSTGIETTINELFDNIAESIGSKQKKIYQDGRACDQRRSVLDNSAIKKAMGWQPQFTLRQGLTKTAEYFKKFI